MEGRVDGPAGQAGQDPDQSQDGRTWVLIAIAGLSLVLGVVAVVIALNAKSASDDAADQASVQSVQRQLSRLTDELGIAQTDLSGREGKTQQQLAASRNAVANLSNRLDKMEKQLRAVEGSADSTGGLNGRVSSLETQTSKQAGEIQSLQRQVTRLENQAANPQG